MEKEEFRKAAHEMIDITINYMETIRERRVLPEVEPGYLQPLIPQEPPQDPETWADVKEDIERVIMPGVTHWHSPRFHAYFPTGNSYPAILADILSDTIGCIGFSWIASPACTELEMSMMDWLAKAFQLPTEFLFESGGPGGGVIQGTASEATLVATLSAKAKKKQRGEKQDMIGYASSQSHSSVERAGLLSDVEFKLVEPDEKYSLRGDALERAILKDLEEGKIPVIVVATLGTTNSCAFDNLKELGEVCNKYGIWLHIDAAYAGSAFICPEYRYLLNGVELGDSFNFNPHKWMLINFDCSALWFRDSTHLVNAFNIDPVYLKHNKQGMVPDYRHWQIPLGRRFRSLKLWFVLRLIGVKGIQEHIRKQIQLAHYFEKLLRSDEDFRITHEVIMALVCFRLKGSDELNEKLLNLINEDGRIHLVPGKTGNEYFLRFAVCSRFTNQSDIEYSWGVIKELKATIINQ